MSGKTLSAEPQIAESNSFDVMQGVLKPFSRQAASIKVRSSCKALSVVVIKYDPEVPTATTADRMQAPCVGMCEPRSACANITVSQMSPLQRIEETILQVLPFAPDYYCCFSVLGVGSLVVCGFSMSVVSRCLRERLVCCRALSWLS